LPRPRAGFSLVEMMIALVVLGVIMGSALTVMRSQSRNFRLGGSKMELTQNIRYTLSTLDRVLRTAGSGVANNQPMLVYADSNTVVINANFASDIQDGNAVYINPNLPLGAALAMTTATPVNIPYTAINYPFANYFWGAATPSRAETIMFFFRPDSTTADPTDYILFQRVNSTPAEMVARNIRHYPGRPFFFDYFTEVTDALGNKTLQQVTYARVAPQRLPVYHSVSHGVPADINNAALADSIRTIRVNVVITNGITTADSTSRTVSTTIGLPNNGLVQSQTCGNTPVLTSALTATSPNPGEIRLQWNPSGDETAGELDVNQYNIYYKLAGAPTWQTYQSVSAGQPAYDITSSALITSGLSYDWAVAAQDCTPAESPLIISFNIPIS
jgi:prepilin-type N-terminal cleavage/methylation domain-containing protein